MIDGDTMIENEKCPCAAVAELAAIVKSQQKQIEKNEKIIEMIRNQRVDDYTKIELLFSSVDTVIQSAQTMQQRFEKFIDEREKDDEKESDDLRQRIRNITDEVLKWGIFLCLGYVAMKLGLM